MLFHRNCLEYIERRKLWCYNVPFPMEYWKKECMENYGYISSILTHILQKTNLF